MQRVSAVSYTEAVDKTPYEALLPSWERLICSCSSSAFRVMDDPPAFASAQATLWTSEASLLKKHGWSLEEFVEETRVRAMARLKEVH